MVEVSWVSMVGRPYMELRIGEIEGTAMLNAPPTRPGIMISG
jgi:hypothetical protein